MATAAAFQTASAAISVVDVAWKTYLFLEKVANAQAEARLLKTRSKRLHQLIGAVETRLKQRRGPTTPRPDEKEIEKVVQSNLSACRKCLNAILPKELRPLTTDQSLKLLSRATQSFRFTLSSPERQQQEQLLETNILTLNTSLSLLQLLEHDATSEKLASLESSMEEANYHLRSLSQVQLARSPTLNNASLQQLEAPAEELDLLGIQSLRETINVARSTYSSNGSDFGPERRSSVRIIDSGEDENRELYLDRPQSQNADLGAEPPEPSHANGVGLGLTEPLDDPDCGHRQPPRLLSAYKQSYRYAADREYAKGNYALAETYQQKSIENAVQLQQAGHQPFADRKDMHERLVDIFMKQKKFGEALRVLSLIHDEVRSSDTAADAVDPEKEDAILCMRFAKVHHCIHAAEKDGDEWEAAREHLRAAHTYALKRAFPPLEALHQAGQMTQQDAQFTDCANLCVQILEDQGAHIEADTFRGLYLSTTSPPPPPPPNPCENGGGFVAVQNSDDHDNEPRLPDEPDRPRITSAIRHDLRERFQEILADPEANADDAINERDRIEVREGKETKVLNWTPLMHAVGCTHEQSCSCDMAIEKLIDHGADINATVGSDADIETALHQAVAAGKAKQVHLLLNRGADKNACAPFTPLATAVKTNQAHLVELLLDHGADPPVDKQKWTLLHHAIANGAFDAFEVLLNPKYRDRIDPSARSAEGRTPLLECAEKADRPMSYAMADLLLEHYNADPNALDGRGRSALYWATTHRWGPQNPTQKLRERFVDLLIDNGADWKKTPEKFRPPKSTFETYPRIKAEMRQSRELKRKDSATSAISDRSRRISVDSKDSRRSKIFSFGKNRSRGRLES
jgi:Ankyrin repeats (3 copies)